MKDNELEKNFQFFLNDSLHPFSGWDFTYIKDRIVTEPITWSYPSIILPYIRQVNSLLDMGTGGGEFLASLQPLPKKTFATEAYVPNIPIAKKTLEPLGVIVRQIFEDNKLPFANDFFELIINRHEAYDAKEVFRALKSEGLFITQQVGGTNDLDINRLLGAEVSDKTVDYLFWNLSYAVNELKDAGFKIIQEKEASPISRCFDIGAIIFYMKAAPWQMPDFSVEKYREQLFSLHKKIAKDGYIDITSERFLIIARKE
ncbi:MAG: class I SAM-dependent methyltransferase [Candidatus Thorarchaeota archaeon]